MPCSSARPGSSGTMPAIDTTSGGARLRRSISRPTKPMGTAATNDATTEPRPAPWARRNAMVPAALAAPNATRAGNSASAGGGIRADGDERRTEPVGEVDHNGHTRDRCARHHDQFEEAACRGHGRTRDDVADRPDQGEPGEQDDQSGRDGHGRFEAQSELGAEPVQRQRRRGCDRAADR
jgi:hypothetical protein